MKSSLVSAILIFRFADPAGVQTEASAVVRKFESVYRPCRTLRANFIEKYSDSGKLVRSDAGVAYFSKPGKMRWEYQSPETNLYIVDGKSSWFYVPGDHTVTKIAAKQSSDTRTPFALLAGEVKVSKLCANVDRDRSVRPVQPSGVVLRCKFRNERSQDAPNGNLEGAVGASATYALFEVDAGTGELTRVTWHDPAGVEVEFQFANWEFNPPLEARLFHFQPPKGVAIVDGSLPDGRGSPGAGNHP